MSDKIRVRFAPSPTGYLHIGGVRTALFNYLYARKEGGTFVLRIEDTDAERSTEESTQAILDGMEWLGLDYDEGPLHQSDRLDLYQEHIDRLLNEGKAYPCYCSKEELEERRKQALKEGRDPKYDGRCRGGADPVPGREPAIRFKAPHTGTTVVHDLIRGDIVFDNSQVDDLIIRRSFGMPTYNLCVVVDDALMGMTHIIRGDDHLTNTPKQILLYEALGYEPPKYAHVPMILGADKTRLSKRHGATSIMAYKEMGYLPEAMLNYLARLGWGHGDEEIFSLEELVEKFSLKGINRSPAVFNPEKLLWLNHHYIKTGDPKRLARLFHEILVEKGILNVPLGDDRREWLEEIVKCQQEKRKTLVEMVEQSTYFFRDDFEIEEKAGKKVLKPAARSILWKFKTKLSGLEAFTEEALESVFKQIMEEEDLKLGKIAQPLRVALTGGTVSPGIFELVSILGKESVLARIDRAIVYMDSRPDPA
ncbi:MAG: glutamate--tRNA ligase [Deltaproteobacteria bacterium]|nr:glutamate--tRNA ligase [Deltaproteobacteria bacterium]